MEKFRSEWVINFQPDQDIQVLGGDADLEILKSRLPQSYERFAGTTYFNRKSGRFAEQSNEILAVWHFRAALAHFQGILDLIESDLPSSCGQMWERNDIRKNLYSHPLVYTMTRVRNTALHSGNLGHSMKDRRVTFLPGGERNVTWLLLDPISAAHFKRTDDLDGETIMWFNKQATIWSANALLTESAVILMTALDTFVRMNLSHIPEQEHAREKTRRAERALSSE